MKSVILLSCILFSTAVYGGDTYYSYEYNSNHHDYESSSSENSNSTIFLIVFFLFDIFIICCSANRKRNEDDTFNNSPSTQSRPGRQINGLNSSSLESEREIDDSLPEYKDVIASSPPPYSSITETPNNEAFTSHASTLSDSDITEQSYPIPTYEESVNPTTFSSNFINNNSNIQQQSYVVIPINEVSIDIVNSTNSTSSNQ